jgi:putative FmdB family regulatory protein
MPLYPYRCDACGHEFEEFQRMAEEPLTECPECDGALRRVPCVVNNQCREFKKPIEMYSIGLNDDDEIREFRRRCPDVDVSTDKSNPLYGVPIARTRAQKLAALDAMNFEERS